MALSVYSQLFKACVTTVGLSVRLRSTHFVVYRF